MENEINNFESNNGDGIVNIEGDISRLIKEAHRLRSHHRKREEEIKKDTKSLFLNLLEIVDSFERVFENIEPHLPNVDKKTKIWVGNFKSIKRLIEKVLKEGGVTTIEAPDKKAIPGFHHIVEIKQVEGLEDDVIIKEKLKGYLRFGEVLRKSEVVTVKNFIKET